MTMLKGTVNNMNSGGLLDQRVTAVDSGSLALRTIRFVKSLFTTTVWSTTGGKPGQERRLRPTAYIDGLRGLAAFVVYWHHHELWAHQSPTHEGERPSELLENAWGFNGQYRFITFYGIRNFFSGGHFAVAIFFVLSGYVLSLKPLSLIHAGEHHKLGDLLASALFRRWFRLYLPLIFVAIATFSIRHLSGTVSPSDQPYATFYDDLLNYYYEFKGFSFVFKDGGNAQLSFDIHLWTVALEMKGSIVIFTVLLALSRATTFWRLLCELCLVIYFIYIVDGYYAALFMVGMLLCDLDGLAQDSNEFPELLLWLEPYKTLIAYILFGVSMFLSGVPTRSRDQASFIASPGWGWLYSWKPQAVFDIKWYFLFWAAVCLVIAVPKIGWLKRFLETRFCQYLGRISFALYLVHGPLLTTIGDRLYFACGWVRPDLKARQLLAPWANLFPLPRVGPMGLEIGFLIPNLVIFPITIWVADVATRVIDDPSVRLATWMYETVKGGPPMPKLDVTTSRLA